MKGKEEPSETMINEKEASQPSDNKRVGKIHQRHIQKEPKTKDKHKANINHSPRSVRSGEQGNCTTKSHRYSITEVYTINPGGQNRAT